MSGFSSFFKCNHGDKASIKKKSQIREKNKNIKSEIKFESRRIKIQSQRKQLTPLPEKYRVYRAYLQDITSHIEKPLKWTLVPAIVFQRIFNFFLQKNAERNTNKSAY